MPYDEVCFQRIKDEYPEECNKLEYKSHVLDSFFKLRNKKSHKD